MDLKDFIATSLQQIIAGVREAQETDGGENVNASLATSVPGGNLIQSGRYGIFTRVDFDVAVSAETSGKGGGNLKVFGVGIEAGGEHRSERANRLVFSVPVRLPDGDKKRAEELEAETARASAIRKRKRAEAHSFLNR